MLEMPSGQGSRPPQKLSGSALTHWQLEERARRAVIGWVGDPKHEFQVRAEVQVVVEMLREALAPKLEPVRGCLAREGGVTCLVARCLGVSGVWSDGSEWPNPFSDWELSEPELASLSALAGDLCHAVRAGGTALAQAGVGLQPDAPCDQLILGQLLLLAVPVEGSALELVAELDVVATAGFGRDGAMLIVSDHASGDDVRLLEQLRRAHRSGLGHPHLHLQTKPTQPSPKVTARHVALGEVQRRFPAAGPPVIRRSWGLSDQSPGGLLRSLLPELPGCPSLRTLYADFHTLGLGSKKRLAR